MNMNQKRIGILTGGGDCPGLNAAIRAIVKSAGNDFNLSVIGFRDGYEGIVENKYRALSIKDASGILTLGGTILGTSNTADPFHFPVLDGDKYKQIDRSSQAVQNFEALGLEALIAIGGDGTMTVSAGMAQKGIPIVGVPKTIDNDIVGTDISFGFDSAVATATDAIDKIHSTAQSHHRVMIVEVMGRNAGWLALYSGLAGGGDIIVIPEFQYDLECICDKIKSRNAMGKNFSIVVVGEGSSAIDGETVISRTVKSAPEQIRFGGISHQLASQIEGLTNIECRVTILGHLLRGGSPSAFDRILATRFGVEAVKMVASRQFGKMVCMKDNKISSIAIDEVGGKQKLITGDTKLVGTAKSLGICMGV